MAENSQAIQTPVYDSSVLILPKVQTDAKFCHFQKELFETLVARIPGAEESQTQVLSLSGFPMNPMGVPHAVITSIKNRDLIAKCLRFIRYGSKQTFSNKRVGAIAVPRISSIGYPYFASRDQGLAVKEAYFQYYEGRIDHIGNLLGKGDFHGLAEPTNNEDLPIFSVTSVSRRGQPDKSTVDMRGGKLIHTTGKDRVAWTMAGEETIASKVLQFSQTSVRMRSRYISAVSATSNLLLQANVAPHRNTLYDLKVFHPTSQQDQLDTFMKLRGMQRPSGILRSLDFSNFDSHMVKLFFDAVIDGAKDAGKSDAFINLWRSIHFSPFLFKNDRVGAKGSRMAGVVGGKIDDVTLDFGNRSGEAPIDVENKILGYGIVCAIAHDAGLVPGEESDAIIDCWKKWTMLEPIFGEKCAPVTNAGDDCLMHFKDEAAVKTFSATMASLAPTLKIEFEPIELTQVLGEMVSQTFKALPALSKAITNHVAPERGIDSPMRKETWQLGNIARDAHYGKHPDWFAYKAVMDEVTLRHFGQTFLGAARSVPSSLANIPIRSMADYLYIENPSAVHYKILIEDVSSDLLEATRFFLNIGADRVEKVQL